MISIIVVRCCSRLANARRRKKPSLRQLWSGSSLIMKNLPSGPKKILHLFGTKNVMHPRRAKTKGTTGLDAIVAVGDCA
jgi:hypothetical protein